MLYCSLNGYPSSKSSQQGIRALVSSQMWSWVGTFIFANYYQANRWKDVSYLNLHFWLLMIWSIPSGIRFCKLLVHILYPLFLLFFFFSCWFDGHPRASWILVLVSCMLPGHHLSDITVHVVCTSFQELP